MACLPLLVCQSHEPPLERHPPFSRVTEDTSDFSFLSRLMEVCCFLARKAILRLLPSLAPSGLSVLPSQGPAYLWDFLSSYMPCRALCSVNQYLLIVSGLWMSGLSRLEPGPFMAKWASTENQGPVGLTTISQGLQNWVISQGFWLRQWTSVYIQSPLLGTPGLTAILWLQFTNFWLTVTSSKRL